MSSSIIIIIHFTIPGARSVFSIQQQRFCSTLVGNQIIACLLMQIFCTLHSVVLTSCWIVFQVTHNIVLLLWFSPIFADLCYEPLVVCLQTTGDLGFVIENDVR